MIKHHPSEQLLLQHSRGELAFSLSIAMSAHIEMCTQCQEKEKELEASQADVVWENHKTQTAEFGDMMQAILATPIENKITQKKIHSTISVDNKKYKLPVAFRSFQQLKWAGFGAINRARVVSDEGNVRASLLHIKKGGEIPNHQHNGYEVTLLLDGSFSDEHGIYNRGDFILLDGDINHSPKTQNGCLCYTVQDAPLHFNNGLSKVLNPLGKLIY